jgi:DNA-binding protein HU-beta
VEVKSEIYAILRRLSALSLALRRARCIQSTDFNVILQGEMPMAEPGSAAKTAAPKAKVETVSSRQLAVALAEKHEMSKKDANTLMEDLVAMVTKHLKKGVRIRINGLGILQVRKRAARMGRNPATGEAIKIKASKKIAFRAAKDLKAVI